MTKALLFKLTHTTSVFACTALLTLALGGCSKKKAEPEKAPVPSASASDPNADGKRLERAVNDWKRRWERIELEKCDELLTDAAELELCKKAEVALTKVKENATKLDKSNAAIQAAGVLVETSEAAIEKLREKAMAAIGAASAAPGTKPAGSVSPPKPMGSVAKPKAKPAGSSAAAGSASAGVRPPEDPRMKVVSSYERVARSAARYLGSFLQQGPLDVRKQAYTEVQRLVPLRERWLTLRDIVRQASLTERDPELRKQLRETEQKLRSSSPVPAGMPGGPLGRPMPGRPGPNGAPPSPGPGPAQRPPTPAAPPPAPPQ